MRMPFATAMLSTAAIVSMGTLASQPARAEYCLSFSSQGHGPYACTQCKRHLEAAATVAFGTWKMKSYTHSGDDCHHPVTCFGTFCQRILADPKLDPSAPFPRGLIPPKTQAHPPLNSSKHPGWEVHIGPHIPK